MRSVEQEEYGKHEKNKKYFKKKFKKKRNRNKKQKKIKLKKKNFLYKNETLYWTKDALLKRKKKFLME